MKLFLFDLDGTLVSTLGAGLRALDKAFSHLFGITNVLQTINPQGKTDPAIFREILTVNRQMDMTQRQYRLISETYLKNLKHEIESSSKVTVLKGVQTFLDFLYQKEDVAMGLGTGNLEKGARTKLSPTNLSNFFPFGGFGSDSEVRSEVLQIGHKRAEARHQTIIDNNNVFIVGDTTLDVAAAKNAGFQSVAVASGNVSYDHLKESNPDFLMMSLEEGPEFYERSI